MQIQDRVAQAFKQTSRDDEVAHLNKGIFPERQVSACGCCSTDLTAHTAAAAAFHGICYTKGKSFCESCSRSRGCFSQPQASPPWSLITEMKEVSSCPLMPYSAKAHKKVRAACEIPVGMVPMQCKA